MSTAGAPRDLEEIRSILDAVIIERQQLRGADADAAILEANRQAIIYWQSQLSAVLVGLRLPSAESGEPQRGDDG